MEDSPPSFSDPSKVESLKNKTRRGRNPKSRRMKSVLGTRSGRVALDTLFPENVEDSPQRFENPEGCPPGFPGRSIAPDLLFRGKGHSGVTFHRTTSCQMIKIREFDPGPVSGGEFLQRLSVTRSARQRHRMHPPAPPYAAPVRSSDKIVSDDQTCRTSPGEVSPEKPACALVMQRSHHFTG